MREGRNDDVLSGHPWDVYRQDAVLLRGGYLAGTSEEKLMELRGIVILLGLYLMGVAFCFWLVLRFQ